MAGKISMRVQQFIYMALATATAATIAAAVSAAETPTPPGAVYHSTTAPAGRRVFFGELHLHTTLSYDAWTYGTKVTPDQAYKFGRGETVMIEAEQVGREEGLSTHDAVPARRPWPLDFMAVTDHSEFIGTLHQLDDPNGEFARSAPGQKILKNPPSAMRLRRDAEDDPAKMPPGLNDPRRLLQSEWRSMVEVANNNYEPGKFTTFIGYEWTSQPEGKNLHRNVIFNSEHAPIPFTALDSTRPEDLWRYLERVRADGIDVIAIPHNGNVSGGLMYDWNGSDGKPIDEAYAQERALNEPLTEIVQIKGQSETAPVLSPNDEFANFEIFDHLLGGRTKSDPHGSYIRDAYGRGLVIQAKVGTNPFKYGLVGGADIHNGLSTSDENTFAGGQFGIDPRTMLPEGATAMHDLAEEPNKNPERPEFDFLERGSAGLTGVWAEENTRNSIFAALKRKETFATSGPRMRLRVFGGWDLKPALLKDASWVEKAYGQGVPMGGDLPAHQGGHAPAFILQALKDPDGANLDRIQVVKVWLAGGTYHEKVFDAIVSGGRKVDTRTGQAPPVGNTVNLKTGEYTNSIGAPQLLGVWHDPQFKPGEAAVYYARVLEIPTPRWSTLLAVKRNLPVPTARPATIQERGFSSPIWYTPPAHSN
jgi:hypothetical protein